VLSYFMAAVLDTAGVNTSVGKANVSLGYAVEQFCFAVFGAFFVERFGRRKLMLCGFFGCALVWVGMTASAATLANSLTSGTMKGGDAKFSNQNAGNAVLFFIFASAQSTLSTSRHYSPFTPWRSSAMRSVPRVWRSRVSSSTRRA